MEMAKFSSTEVQILELKPNLLRWVKPARLLNNSWGAVCVWNAWSLICVSCPCRCWMVVTLTWDVLDTPSQVVWILIITSTQTSQWALLMTQWFCSGEIKVCSKTQIRRIRQETLRHNSYLLQILHVFSHLLICMLITLCFHVSPKVSSSHPCDQRNIHQPSIHWSGAAQLRGERRSLVRTDQHLNCPWFSFPVVNTVTHFSPPAVFSVEVKACFTFKAHPEHYSPHMSKSRPFSFSSSMWDFSSAS